MSTKTEKGSVYATLLFQVSHYCLRPWPWIIVALSCLLLYPEISPVENPDASGSEFGKAYVRSMRDYLPIGLKGLLLASFLGAYLSTISTQLNWGAGYLVNDFYKRFISPDKSDKVYVKASQIVTLLLMLAGLFITLLMNSVSGVWAFILECGAGLGLVLILRWYWWRINAWTEIAATVAPFIGYSLARFAFDLTFPNSFFITVGFTTIAWLATMYFTRPESAKTLLRFYKQLRPGGDWSAIPEKERKEKNNLTPLFVSWIASVTMAYSVLFTIGKFLFSEWQDAFLYLGVSVISLAVLIVSLRRTSIWK